MGFIDRVFKKREELPPQAFVVVEEDKDPSKEEVIAARISEIKRILWIEYGIEKYKPEGQACASLAAEALDARISYALVTAEAKKNRPYRPEPEEGERPVKKRSSWLPEAVARNEAGWEAKLREIVKLEEELMLLEAGLSDDDFVV